MRGKVQEWINPQVDPYLEDTDLALDLEDHILILIFTCRHGTDWLDLEISKITM